MDIQKELDVWLDADEPGAQRFESEQCVRALRVDELDLREIDLVGVGSSRVDLQACKLEYSIVSPK